MKMISLARRTFLSGVLGMLWVAAQGQDGYWQQRVEYKMDIDMDVKTHRFTGEQRITYYNNSPDTLDRVFYYLFFNAFQPNSQMDVRSRTIADPDRRVGDRISQLGPDEIGYHKIESLKQDGKNVRYEVVGTILEVTLASPILPGSKATFDMEFNSQVPVQIRRSGRDSDEDIAYTMTQWYPKLCEYDREGWHAHPYIGREFHGVWGDYEVNITLDSSYVIGGTGHLQNPDKIGHGYASSGERVRRPGKDQLTWNFKASNVHDFAWAADPEYRHDKIKVPDGPEIHFFYKPANEEVAKNWKELQGYAIRLFQIMNNTFGVYPWDTYSVIQGGDGGMEYPMCTMITGNGSFRGLVGVTVHEVIHSWYQGALANNEAKYPWMDEGFTSYASALVSDKLFDGNRKNPHERSIQGFTRFAKAGLEEPASTHSDHYQTNRAYSVAAYTKGAVMLSQLQYILGDEAFFKAFKRYFNTWKFKHPEPRDMKRVLEKSSGLELDWFYEHWIHTTNTIDYAVDSLESTEEGTVIHLSRIDPLPMPVDVMLTFADGSQELHTIPLEIMRGAKTADSFYEGVPVKVEADWPWTHPTYSFSIDQTGVVKAEIDPSKRLADANLENNVGQMER